MIIPDSKVPLVDETKALVKDFEQQYQDGLITQQEKYNKVIDAWSRCGDRVAAEMMKEISAVKKGPDGRELPINAIYMMAHSGARGSAAQIKQLAGMRGLMAKPSGRDHRDPDHLELQGRPDRPRILQLDPTAPARALADTALKTANSGYLTRRLVDVSQDCVVVENDCGTERRAST